MSNFARRLNSAVRARTKLDGVIKGYRQYGSGAGNGVGSSGVDEKHLKVVAIKLAAHPLALDMLVFILKTLIEKRKESRNIDKKFTEIKVTTQRFKNSIALAEEWGVELLNIAGFRRIGDSFKITNVDPARLWLVKSFLEEERKSDTYVIAKRKVDFQKVIDKALQDKSEEEVRRRRERALKVSPPPPEGAGGSSRVYVFLGKKIVNRFFYHDDMLSEVFLWIGATQSSTIEEKLLDGTYELINQSLYPGKVLDYKAVKSKTLSDLGLSPSGELHVQPAGLFTDEREMHGLNET